MKKEVPLSLFPFISLKTNTFYLLVAESCSPCEEGFYASESGMAQCLPCGAGTTSTSSGTGCDLNDCQFVVEEDKIMYDLSALISGQDMYGPIWGDNTAFFLSPCKVCCFWVLPSISKFYNLILFTYLLFPSPTKK